MQVVEFGRGGCHSSRKISAASPDPPCSHLWFHKCPPKFIFFPFRTLFECQMLFLSGAPPQ